MVQKVAASMVDLGDLAVDQEVIRYQEIKEDLEVALVQNLEESLVGDLAAMEEAADHLCKSH